MLSSMSTIVEKNPTTSPSANILHSRSRVPFSAHVAGTYRFGDYTPHFVAEAVNGDKWSLRSCHNIRSYTMKAPLMSRVNIKKDYFMVPNEAILPLNWDKVYTPPVNGDDVNALNVNCTLVYEFPVSVGKGLIDKLNLLKQDYEDDRISGAAFDTIALKVLITLERFFSNGSLLATLGYHVGKLFGVFGIYDEDNNKYRNFDAYFDAFVTKLFNGRSLVFVDDDDVYYTITNDLSVQNAISPVQFLEYARDHSNWEFEESTSEGTPVESMYYEMPIDTLKTRIINCPKTLNLSRVLAYQIVCSHFYTNDKIDYVYSAELYRQNVYSAFSRMAEPFGWNNVKFTWNGLECRYDYLSGYFFRIAAFDLMQRISLTDASSSVCINNYFDYWRLILGFNRSLRFVDYFTGAKSQPLAVGDINIDVNAGKVNAVDVTRNIQRQKFFNAVNRVGRRFDEYLKSFGGNNVALDYHNPLYLAHTSDIVSTSENSNTGVDQFSKTNSVTSTMDSYANKFAFETSIDRPCILIGITYFDIPRYYSENIERQNFHVDRFDMFNQYMQFIGDQELYGAELHCYSPHTFGYALRHSEYKTRVNQCFGAFADGLLPGWQFIADEGINSNLIKHIGPDYIRSRASELDVFFDNLTGYSLGSRFHFIIDTENDCNPSRPMVFAPTIL